MSKGVWTTYESSQSKFIGTAERGVIAGRPSYGMEHPKPRPNITKVASTALSILLGVLANGSVRLFC